MLRLNLMIKEVGIETNVLSFRILAVCILTLLMWQDIWSQTQAKRGFQPNSSFAVSDIETINTANGNLMLNIPLASLPGGRGGAGGVGVNLVYNGKLWDAKSVVMQNGTAIILKDAAKGGWKFSYKYNLEVIYKPNEEYRPYTSDNCETDFTNSPKRYKFMMNFPDGSSRQFHPSPSNPSPIAYQYNNYYNVQTAELAQILIY
jgi:hypothetical protein